jgi:hypothetical protein
MRLEHRPVPAVLSWMGANDEAGNHVYATSRNGNRLMYTRRCPSAEADSRTDAHEVLRNVYYNVPSFDSRQWKMFFFSTASVPALGFRQPPIRKSRGKVVGAWCWPLTSYKCRCQEYWIYVSAPSYVSISLCSTNLAQRQIYTYTLSDWLPEMHLFCSRIACH